MFESTLDRFGDKGVFEAPHVVIGEAHLEFAESQALGIQPDTKFVIEPAGRNTAPAIALAAHALSPDDVMLVCPSDHFIADPRRFQKAAIEAAELAAEDWLVSFGIEITAPETGFGYIRRGEAVGTGYRIEQFVEKPDAERAQQFISHGGYCWNGGIFSFRAGKFLEQLERFRPEMAAAIGKSYGQGSRQGQHFRPAAAVFASIDGDSVDYAVMEHTDRAAMVDAAMGWSDIGNWDALMSHRAPDPQGNVIIGSGEVLDGSGNMIDSDGPKVSLVGLSNVVVVVDGNDILVVDRGAVQMVNKTEGCRNQ